MAGDAWKKAHVPSSRDSVRDVGLSRPWLEGRTAREPLGGARASQAGDRDRAAVGADLGAVFGRAGGRRGCRDRLQQVAMGAGDGADAGGQGDGDQGEADILRRHLSYSRSILVPRDKAVAFPPLASPVFAGARAGLELNSSIDLK